MSMLVNSFVFGVAVDEYIALTIPSGTVDSDLTDFPLFINLSDMPAAIWGNVDNGGGNIRAFEGDASTALPLDVVFCDTGAETGSVFVKTSLTTAVDTVVILKWEAAGTLEVATTHADGRDAVWSDYERVYTFGDSLEDRTGNSGDIVEGGTASPVNSQLTETLYALGGSEHDSAPIEYKDSGGVTSFTTWTMACTYEIDKVAQMALMSYRDESSGAAEDRVTLLVDNGNSIGVWDEQNGWMRPGINPGVGTPHRMVTTYSGTTNRKLYHDGVLTITDTTITARDAGFDELTIGTDDDTRGDRLDGKIGFAYLRGEALSEDWLSAEYDNLNSPSTFYDAVSFPVPPEPITAKAAATYVVEQKFGLADVGARDAAIYVVDYFTSPDHQLSTEAWVYVIES